MDAVSQSVNLSGAVMAHPKRVTKAQLIADADAHGRVKVVFDPEPDGKPTALRVAPLCWSCVPPEATHHVVLQDDVILAEGFYEHAERVAAAVPHEAIAFYAGWEARNGAVARLAALTGNDWAHTLQEHVPCQALMLPADLARGYARFQQEHGDGWPYDVVMQRYLNAAGVPVRFCTPSTVQHDDLPSLAGNNYHGLRQATLFSATAAASAVDRCPRFPVVPFYQYGEARCAVQHGAEWEYVETERYLRRIGLLERCLATIPHTERSLFSEYVTRAVWLTGFAIGVVTHDAPEPDSAVATAVMNTLGPGGLCEDFTAEELLSLAPAVRNLALAALEQGRAAGLPDLRASHASPDAPTVAVTGVDHDFARQLARLLGDMGYRTTHVATPTEAGDLTGTSSVVHLGRPGMGRLPDVLAAAVEAGVERLVFVGSAAIYRGSGERVVTEDSLTSAPKDPIALGWWREEQQCLQWSQRTGIAVQVLRMADPVGPHAPADSPCVRWVHLAWTRRPLTLDPREKHHVLDYRDMADAIRTVLVNPPARLVFNVASATYGEEELAGLLADVSRRTPWEQRQADAPQRWTMTTELIETELNWQGSSSVHEALRALAQWYACDIHGDYDARRVLQPS